MSNTGGILAGQTWLAELTAEAAAKGGDETLRAEAKEKAA